MKETIIDLFKSLFIPSDDYFTKEIEKIHQKFKSKTNVDDVLNVFNELKRLDSSPLDDIFVSVNGKNIKVIDNSYLRSSIDLIRKFIGGLLWFLLGLYHYNQIYYLIRGTYLFLPSKSSK